MSPTGLASKIKAQMLFPSDKFMGVFFSGSLQVNGSRDVGGIGGVKRVVCRIRLEFFG